MKILNEYIDRLSENDIRIVSGTGYQYRKEILPLALAIAEHDYSVGTFKSLNPTLLSESNKLESAMRYFDKFHCFLAKDKSKAIGMALGYVKGNEGHFSHLYVKPEYRFQGLGQRLFEKAINWLAPHAETIKLTVVGGNESVLNFYKKNGFQISEYEMRLAK